MVQNMINPFSKYIEQLKFKVTGVSIFAVHVSDIEKTGGKINTLRIIGECKNRPNSIIETWNTTGWEKNGQGMINFIDESGLKKFAILVSESGETTNIYTEPRDLPNLERVIGPAATIDDISEAMDMNRSMKYIFIGGFIGTLLGWLIVGPLLNGIFRMAAS